MRVSMARVGEGGVSVGLLGGDTEVSIGADEGGVVCVPVYAAAGTLVAKEEVLGGMGAVDGRGDAGAVQARKVVGVDMREEVEKGTREEGIVGIAFRKREVGWDEDGRSVKVVHADAWVLEDVAVRVGHGLLLLEIQLHMATGDRDGVGGGAVRWDRD